jgi:hypothetical protein
MANSKISALTAATTPVAGTEVLPIVQSSSTVKLAISDLNPGLSTITAAKGGTGQTSYAVGDLLYASTTTALSKLADVATGNALISGGISTAPSWGKIGLTTHVSGTLPIANGGTNASSASITAFNNITGYAASGATGTTSTNLVFSTSPTLVTPTLGAALATSIKFGSGAVLSSYEEGTWTPTDVSGASLSFVTAVGTYTKIGRMVYLQANITYPVTSNTNAIGWGTFPFTAANGNHVNAIAWSDGAFAALNFYASTTAIYSNITSATGNLNLTNNLASNKNFRINIFYSV